jgi:hypothetical protein
LLFVLASLGLLVAGLAEDSQSLVWTSLIASLSACGCLVGSVLNRRRVIATGTAGPPPGQPIDLGSPAPDPALPAPTSPAQPPWAAPPAAPVSPDPAGAPYRPPDADAFAVPPQRPDAGPDAATSRPDTVAGLSAATGRPDSVTGLPAAAPPAAAEPGPLDPPDAGSDPTGPAWSTDSVPPASPAPAAPVAPADEPAVEDIPVADALRVAQLPDEVLVVDGRPRYHLADCPRLAGRATVPLPVSAARRAGFTPCGDCQPDRTLLARSRSAARPQS